MKTRWMIYLLAALAVVLLIWAPIAAAEGAESSKGNSEQAKSTLPTSIDSMIERRRDAMEKRRERYWDAVTGRRWHRPPWTNARQDWIDRKNDAVDETFRQRRDVAEAQRDAWGRWHHPRTQWNEDIAEARRDAWSLDRLIRDEMREQRLYGRRLGYRPY